MIDRLNSKKYQKSLLLLYPLLKEHNGYLNILTKHLGQFEKSNHLKQYILETFQILSSLTHIAEEERKEMAKTILSYLYSEIKAGPEAITKLLKSYDFACFPENGKRLVTENLPQQHILIG